MINARIRLLPFAALVAFVVACSGGGGSSVSPPTLAKQTQTVKMNFAIPAAPATASTKLRRAFALSQSTQGATLNVYTSPKSANPTPVATLFFDLSSTSPNCSTSATLARSCSVSATIAPGTYDFEVKTTDVNSATASGHQLGYGIVAAQVIAPGGSNNISVSIGGVASAALLTIPYPKVHRLDTSSQVVTVAVLDADKNTIVSNGYVDASGNPVTVSFSDAGSVVTFSPATLTAPGTQVTMTYKAPTTWTAANLTAAMSDAITLTLTPGSAAAPVTLSADAPITKYTPFPAGYQPNSIVTGGDGRLWIPLHATAGSDLIAAVNAGTAVATTYAISGMGSGPVTSDITYSSTDNNVWFNASNTGYVGAMNTSGTMVAGSQWTFFAGPSAGAVVPAGLAASNTGLSPAYGIWVTDSAVHTNPSFPPYTVEAVQMDTGTVNYGHMTAPTGTSQYIVHGPDGRMWFTEPANNKIAVISSGGGNTTEYTVPTANAQPWGICNGPDGNLWFTEETFQAVPNDYGFGKVTTGGAFSVTGLPTSVTAPPLRCSAGLDGNTWLTFASGYGGIARVTPGTSAVQLLPLASTTGTNGVTVGVDGNIWITAPADDALYKVIP